MHWWRHLETVTSTGAQKTAFADDDVYPAVGVTVSAATITSEMRVSFFFFLFVPFYNNDATQQRLWFVVVEETATAWQHWRRRRCR